MNELERFLTTDPQDSLCGQTMEILHVFVEETDPAALHPGVAFASQVSAVTCSRAGANPPWASELNCT